MIIINGRCCVRLVAVGDARVIPAADVVVVVVVVAWMVNMVGSIVARSTNLQGVAVCRNCIGLDWIVSKK